MGTTLTRIGIGLWGVALAGLMLLVFSGGPQEATPRAIADDAFSCAAVTHIPQSECEALVEVYASTNGESWTDDRGWLFEEDPCFWRGVTCSVDHVIKLRLDANHLTGVLPAELGNLPELLDLDLSSNDIGGSLPPELGNLSKLQGLYLAHNALDGAIPGELGNLSDLDYLGLNDNRLSGSIPPELGNLAGVQNFYLSSNRLTGTIPPELDSLASVQFLWLSNNLLGGTVPAELGNLPRLLQLSMANNNLTGSLPAELGDLAALRRLYVNDNTLVGPLPTTLSNLTTLDYFWFHETFLCDPEDSSLTAWLDGIDHLRTSELLCSDGPPATLAITKAVVGPVPAADWSFYGSGAIGAFELAAAGETVTHTVIAGTYAITETELPGYAAEVACTDGQPVLGGSVNIELDAGAQAGCTFTNTAQPAHLTVVKQLNGSAPDTDWSFTTSDGMGSFSLPAAGGSEAFAVASGAHIITETTQSGYYATVACTDGNTGGSSVRVDLDPSVDTTCTFVNTSADQPLPGTLVVTKTVIGEAPGSAWTFSGSGGIGPFELPATGGVTAFALDAGAYTLTEAAATGYTQSVTCSDGSTGERVVAVTLQGGANVGCTFVNAWRGSVDTGGVRGVVYVDENDNGEVEPGEGVGDATVTISNALPYSDSVQTAVDGVYAFADVPVGEYSLTVTPPPGYEPPSAASVSVTSGATTPVDPIVLQPESVYGTNVSLPALHRN